MNIELIMSPGFYVVISSLREFFYCICQVWEPLEIKRELKQASDFDEHQQWQYQTTTQGEDYRNKPTTECPKKRGIILRFFHRRTLCNEASLPWNITRQRDVYWSQRGERKGEPNASMRTYYTGGLKASTDTRYHWLYACIVYCVEFTSKQILLGRPFYWPIKRNKYIYDIIKILQIENM